MEGLKKIKTTVTAIRQKPRLFYKDLTCTKGRGFDHTAATSILTFFTPLAETIGITQYSLVPPFYPKCLLSSRLLELFSVLSDHIDIFSPNKNVIRQ